MESKLAMFPVLQLCGSSGAVVWVLCHSTTSPQLASGSELWTVQWLVRYILLSFDTSFATRPTYLHKHITNIENNKVELCTALLPR